MTDDRQPPKLRLLVKGQEKVDSLFRRRKKAKKTDEDDQHVSKDDFEDGVPILSRIADPAATQPLKLKLNANAPMTTNIDNAVQPAQDDDGEEIQLCAAIKDHERAVKEKRRRGIVGIDDLNDSQQFKSETIVAHNRAIAKQPTPASQPQQFTFNNSDQAATQARPTFGPQTAQVLPTESQLQQAARNAFLDPGPKPKRVPEEHFASEQNGMTIKQYLHQGGQNWDKGKNSKSTPAKIAAMRAVQAAGTPDLSAKQTQPQSPKGPLEHLKLNSKQPKTPPFRLDTASPVASISNYVRPQIEIPEPGPELYRSSGHMSPIPPHLLTNTIPDRTESQLFAQDVEDETSSTRSTAFGDVPALSHVSGERVPLGARISNDKDDIEINSITTTEPPKPRRLRRHLRGMTDQNKTNPDRYGVPQTFYTAPNRLSNAYLAARKNLRRKRPLPSCLPPPDHIYQHTGSSAFNIFTNGILLYPELVLLLAKHLPAQTLINLYSISKDFHVIVNQRFTTVVLNQLRLKAPHAARCYPWRCYQRLCQPDPALRAGTEPLTSHVSNIRPRTSHGGTSINIKPAPPPTHAIADAPSHPIRHNNTSLPTQTRPAATAVPSVYRKVPTFRYLHLAIHREKTIWQIYQLFAARGVPLPGHPSASYAESFVSTMHKLWFLMDIPDNPRRIAYTHSDTLFTAHDLSNTLVFIVKLDMLLNDPVGGEKRDGVRKMLLSATDGLDTLRRVLQRRDWTDELAILRAWTRYGLQLDGDNGTERAIGGGWVPLNLTPAQHLQSPSVFGIPRAEVGLLKREFWGKLTYDTRRKQKVVNGSERGWGRKPMYLIRPDQLVLREAVRRKLVFRKQFLRALLWGYVDEESDVFERLPAADYNGGRNPVLDAEGEYEVDDVIAGVRALSLEEGSDELLDLGDSRQGSPWTVAHHPPTKREMRGRKDEKERVEGFMEVWRDEVRREREEEQRLRMGFGVLE